ncbi:MAG: adenylyl-sulfate kinase, partial [Aliifodinibius sp.]|nr:adenylyl-sulfate kinase [Fodinibius sp.]
IYCNCPFDILAKRDPKGLYKRALAGEIKDFTGLDSPYEPPESPEISVHTDRQTVEESLSFIFSSLKKFQLLDEEGE